MTRAEILEEARRIVTKDRNIAYGEPEDLFTAINVIMDGIDMARGNRTRDERDTSLYMIAVKLARAAANPQHIDSWVDIAGYAACGGEIAVQQEQKGLET